MQQNNRKQTQSTKKERQRQRQRFNFAKNLSTVLWGMGVGWWVRFGKVIVVSWWTCICKWQAGTGLLKCVQTLMTILMFEWFWQTWLDFMRLDNVQIQSINNKCSGSIRKKTFPSNNQRIFGKNANNEIILLK